MKSPNDTFLRLYHHGETTYYFSQNYRQKIEGVCQGLKGGEHGELFFRGYRVSVLQDKKGLWRWVVIMVAQR